MTTGWDNGLVVCMRGLGAAGLPWGWRCLADWCAMARDVHRSLIISRYRHQVCAARDGETAWTVAKATI